MKCENMAWIGAFNFNTKEAERKMLV